MRDTIPSCYLLPEMSHRPERESTRECRSADHCPWVLRRGQCRPERAEVSKLRLASKVQRAFFTAAAACALAMATTGVAAAAPIAPAIATPSGHNLCAKDRLLCTEVYNSKNVFGHYVGHDEPSVLFYSNHAGSGNHMRYSGIIPKDPPSKAIPGKRSYNFMLYPAFWYGMAMCDTQSYPNTVKICPPDSNSNIAKPGDPHHAGTAFMELQFYPPGYVQQFNGFSCAATKWCVAMNIDSLSLNPVTGKALNTTCQATGPLTGEEYVNFAYLTHSGKPQGPPSPINFNPIASGKPNLAKDLTLNPGDHYTVTLHDTAHGLRTIVADTTTGQRGLMTASAANGFGQIKYAPNGTTCKNIPYDFHPMYSTSSTKTTVPWAAATYNVAFDTEIGHFDYCRPVVSTTGACTGTEGAGSNIEPTDADDIGCFPASASLLVRVNGCLNTNSGFDGTSYLRDWPNGNRHLTPSPTRFTSPLTGATYNTNYTKVGFNTDLPDLEGQTGVCNQNTGSGCTLIPLTDDSTPAAFYPYYTSGRALGGCVWAPGQSVPGFTRHNFGKNAQYGELLRVTYTGLGGVPFSSINDFQKILPNNPCPQG
jgi:hypothetical protein